MKCEVLYVERSMYEGADPDCPWPRFVRRTSHRSFFAADFARRFRPAYTGPGWSSYTTTMIVKPGAQWSAETADSIDVMLDPRYLDIVVRFLWNPLYWLRKRWDGLRYGLDRDRK